MLPHNAKMPHNVYLEFIDFLTTLSRVNSLVNASAKLSYDFADALASASAKPYEKYFYDANRLHSSKKTIGTLEYMVWPIRTG